ncbi:MAG: O-antigen ligase family protein [Bryobacteraceae bacterium]
MAALLAVAVALTALIITPGYLFYFDITPKLIVLLVGTAAGLVWMAVAPERGSGPIVRSRAYTSFGILLLANAVSLALAAAGSQWPALSWFGSSWRRYGALAQIAVFAFAWLTARCAAGRPDRIRTILRGAAIATVAGAIYGIFQYFGHDPFLPAAAYHIGEGIWTIVRPPGTMGYVSYFATWLLMGAFLCLALAGLEERGVWRYTAMGAAPLAIGAMLLTGTRAAMLGLVAGVAVWLYGRGWQAEAPAPQASEVGQTGCPLGPSVNPSVSPSARPALRPIFRWLLGLAAVVASVAFYFSPAGWNLRSRVRWFAEDPRGGSRALLWRDSLRMAGGRPAAGYGPDVFTRAFPPFESKQLARAYPDFAHESPHNMFLDALVAQGIPGCVILLALCGLGLWAGLWPALRGAPRRPAGVPLAAALAAGIVSQQFTAFTLPTGLLCFVTVALAVAPVSQPAGERAFPITLRSCAALAALALIYAAARFAVSDRALGLARRELERGDPAAAAASYSTYERWRLPGTTADLWYSRALANYARTAANPVAGVQALANAGAASLRATTLAEDPFNAWYNVASLYAAQNDSAHTEASLRAAILAHPRWFKPHWMLAQVLSLAGRTEEARREAALAVNLNGAKNPEVTATLRQIQLHP